MKRHYVFVLLEKEKNGEERNNTLRGCSISIFDFAALLWRILGA